MDKQQMSDYNFWIGPGGRKVTRERLKYKHRIAILYVWVVILAATSIAFGIKLYSL